MTGHLSTEELISFVTAQKFDDEFIALACRVNAHCLQCRQCMERMQAVKVLHNAMLQSITDGQEQKDALTEAVYEAAEVEHNEVGNKNGY